METYTSGLKLKTESIITKHDIITMCKLLNNQKAYFLNFDDTLLSVLL